MKLLERHHFNWPRTSAPYAPCRDGLVVHYDSQDQHLASKGHAACVEYWKWCRSFHINGRGWRDIGYSFAVCPHGYVLEGRGWQKEQAAQPNGNTTHTSVTFMSGPSERPTALQVNAFRELRQELMAKGLGPKILGHRDFFATSCPGNILYQMVQNGSLSGKPGEIEEDEVRHYVSVGLDQEIELPPNKWVTVTWDREYADREHHHWNKGGSSIVVGPADYSVTANVRITGLTPGTELQARLIEHPEKPGKLATGPISEHIASKGDTFVHHDVSADTVGDNYRVRFQVIHYGTETARIIDGSAKCFVWPR